MLKPTAKQVVTHIIPRALVDGFLFSLASWLVSQAGLWFCYFTFELFGKVFYPVFYVLANWPNMIVLLFGTNTPQSQPNYANALQYSCVVSFIGWLILGLIVAFCFHWTKTLKSQRTITTED
jgi:hypothetical protein